MPAEICDGVLKLDPKSCIVNLIDYKLFAFKISSEILDNSPTKSAES